MIFPSIQSPSRGEIIRALRAAENAVDLVSPTSSDLTPAVRSQNDFNCQKQYLLMQNSLSIFDIESKWLADEVYVHGITPEVKEIVSSLGGVTKTARLMGLSYHS